MKSFFRELPTPILTYANYNKFISCAGTFPFPFLLFLISHQYWFVNTEITSEEEQINHLTDIVSNLPQANYDLLKFLFSLLYDLSLLADETQMTAENLAKVISPNLIWKESPDINDLSLVDDALKGNSIVNFMILNNDKIFVS